MNTNEANYDVVHQLIEWKRYKEALKEAQSLLQQDPDDSSVHALIGWTYALMGENDKAITWSNQSLGLNVNDQLAWYTRVIALYQAKQEEDCLEAISEALKVDPNEDYYYFIKASLLNKNASYAQAKEHILIALELNPTSAIYLSLLSYIESLLGNRIESIKMEKLALQYETENHLVYMQLAWTATERGEFAIAEEYMRQAVRLNPEDNQVRDEYLEALQKNSKLYKTLLGPFNLLKRLKPWQLLLSWFLAWILFKPLVVGLIILYVVIFWTSKAIVHVKVFGWQLRK